MNKGFRFELDQENKILLIRFEERQLTNESLAEFYTTVRQYSISTDAYAGIFDFSSVTQVDVSTAFIRQLALGEPAMPRANERGRIVVFTNDVGFGLARIFQMLGEPTRPLFLAVRTLDEALEALGVQSPQFERLA
jgi:hypothetical protein